MMSICDVFVYRVNKKGQRTGLVDKILKITPEHAARIVALYGSKTNYETQIKSYSDK